VRTSSKSAKPVSILIVDDNEFVRWAIRETIAKSRPEWNICGEATNGEEALNIVMALEPDVVLLDQSMPRMTGLSAAAHIKKHRPRTHVLLLTAYQLEDLSDPVEARSYTYVDKSNAARDLVPAVELLVTKGKRRQKALTATASR
jgi:DNA-binding NarL/FixJ family response regulator